MKTLIVDDEIVSRKKLQKIMEYLCDCVAVDNGEEALREAKSEKPPDLILLDIIMPGMTGYEVLGKLKEEPRTRDIPVIFLSAMDDKDDVIRGLQGGAVDYITKPFHAAEVKARVLNHLNLKRMSEDLKAQNITLEKQVQEIQDKTELLRQKDIQLLEMDRIAGIGTLAAGIAHEINNPLGFLKSSLDFLLKSTNMMIDAIHYWDDKPVPEPLLTEYRKFLDDKNFNHLTETKDKRFERIQRGIERIMKIVNSLRSFSRVDMAVVEDLDINRSIDEAVDILSTQDSGNIEFVKEFAGLPTITCSPNELNQCLLHVIKNAVDAVAGKGVIRISTAYDDAGKEITIQVTDNGIGMSPEVLRQAFHPFFTTKPVGSGTGVGLSLTERIIKSHDGTIRIDSIEGQGTTVTMTLPVRGEG